MKTSDRFYDIDGVGRLPSVTTILSVIAKPALYGWYAKHGSAKALRVMEMVGALDPAIYNTVKEKLGDEFFKNGTNIASESADYGKKTHSYIEQFLKTGAIDFDVLAVEQWPVVNAVGSFLKWRDKTDLEVIKAESLVFSKKLKYAGTCDAICRINGVVTALDWKSGSRLYPEHRLQLMAYKYAAEEMTGERIPNAEIWRFSRDGTVGSCTIPEVEHPDLFDRFIDAKRLWEWQREQAV